MGWGDRGTRLSLDIQLNEYAVAVTMQYHLSQQRAVRSSVRRPEIDVELGSTREEHLRQLIAPRRTNVI